MCQLFILCGRFLLGLLFAVALISCGSSKKAQKELLYLQGNLDTLPNTSVLNRELIIQKGDLLSIIFYSDNAEATSYFNQQQVAVNQTQPSEKSTGTAAFSPLAGTGYLVNSQGFIHIQAIGDISVIGLTKQELATLLIEKVKSSLQNPHVDIKFLNFRFTVLGEVARPGIFTIPEDRVSILEMLGIAGDLTIYGRRDNILVIREKDGQRVFGRIDLRKSDIFQSPYFYLQQNDVILVEPNPKKPSINDQVATRNLTIATSIASLLSTVAILINIIK